MLYIATRCVKLSVGRELATDAGRGGSRETINAGIAEEPSYAEGATGGRPHGRLMGEESHDSQAQ